MGKNFAPEKVDIDPRLQAINQQLEKVSVRQKGGKLYVRGKADDSFPPRPGQDKPRRVELALNCNASMAGLKVAKAKAQEIDSQLLWGRFDWGPYLKGKQRPAKTVAEWIDKYEADHWASTPRTLTKENSYQQNYRLFFNRLPQERVLTLDLLRTELLKGSKPGTRSREFYCMAYGRLAKFMAQQGAIAPQDLATFQAELKSLKQGYSPKKILPEDLPNDEQIVEIWQSLKNPSWQWIYGMLATYGLRPHEVFHIDVEQFTPETEVLRVADSTKTGTRLVYPCPASWRTTFKLWNVRYPNIQREGRSNSKLGEKISQRFREIGIGHNPYALRHAWCIRTALLGVPDASLRWRGFANAAKWAGHSVAVRTQTYHQAISEAQHQQVFERMKQAEQSQLTVRGSGADRAES
ncbi:hypothetical protein IQ260_23405 [Leptolyngbya cf. ectocarpi LEGE 11479]|uniref:Tyr recombinase domain-containing protein n=1 Tax=Leptolyngbya cf. ectocarpi LEGE 11479 TaxID=1828722 RepID=A0A928ZY52_LEPEC|nr:hypothetical protein [Leptolyngbya ectocarpi]MBE9069597.1 hypothetical protein [Leptolyngbya cf. ectocarpi LEGE 11479]